MPCSDATEQLKGEGNALFVENDFAGAYNKYTQALRHDDKNASLYCNRAACSLGLDRYMDASTDAVKATELDPGYAKAWALLAAARLGLSRPDLAVSTWKRALSLLPTEDLTLAQQRQRVQYRQGLAVTESKLSERVPWPGVTMRSIENAPWNRAAPLLPHLSAQGYWDSSAWIICYAYQQWEEAVNGMRQGRTTITSTRGTDYYGRPGVIEVLSNAILTDERVFHITDDKFLDSYNKQMAFEVTRRDASRWAQSGSKQIIEELPRRLGAEGWDSVRPALSLVVRAWIIRAFMESKARSSPEIGLAFLDSALEVIAFGKERYKDVTDDHRGAIFKPAFIRGIKCMRLDMFMTAYSNHPGANSRYPMRDLLAGADEILAELSTGGVMYGNGASIGFYHAFYRYPAAQAHTTRAFYYRHTALLLCSRGVQRTTPEVCDLLWKAGCEYMEAVKLYPIDEEHFTWFIHCAFQAHWEAGAPLKYLLLLLDQMDRSIPLVKKIWEYSADALSVGCDELLQPAMDQRWAWLEDIRKGRLSENDIVQKADFDY